MAFLLKIKAQSIKIRRVKSCSGSIVRTFIGPSHDGKPARLPSLLLPGANSESVKWHHGVQNEHGSDWNGWTGREG